jgi:hypothetical protein
MSLLMLLASFLVFPYFSSFDITPTSTKALLATEQISLENRQPDSFVNSVFKDNILLNLAYLDGRVIEKEDIDWDKIREPIISKITLDPEKTFAFHEDVSSEYEDSLAVTTNANFNYQDGFKSDGYLMGNGVCHLASLIYWVAKEAGLDAYAPTNHDFAVIPGISREYGVAIYYMPGLVNANARQNLYVTNNKENPVIFEFVFDGENLRLSILEQNT